MPFEKFKSPIERKLERIEEEEKDRKKLTSFIKEIAEHLKITGVCP